MYGMQRSFNIFSEELLSEYFAKREREMLSQVQQEAENYILNVNESDYLGFMRERYSVEVPDIDIEGITVTSYEGQIPAEQFPYNYHVIRGKKYPRNVIVYHIPFSGDDYLYRCQPSRRIVWSTEVYIQDQCICFEIIVFNDDVEQLKSIADRNIRQINEQLDYVKNEVRFYNDNLIRNIEQTFSKRKQSFLKKNNLLASLGVPIKTIETLPQTYSIPKIDNTRQIISRPTVSTSNFRPEPTLENSTYIEILQTIHDIGKVFERLPSTYSEKGEEDLRDHLLLYLEPRFKGAASGETFNGNGKTDILIRYENSNIFIAECKFWNGQKQYLQTISQLLGYLTWRDSKSACIIFVRNKDFSSVLKVVETVTASHENYLGFIDKREDSWFNYRFHVNGDRNREVKLAVLLFHIPIK